MASTVHRIASVVAILGTASLVVAAHVRAEGQQARPAAPHSSAPVEYRAVLDRFCISCHNQGLRTAGLALDIADLTRVPEKPEVWEKVIRKLHAGSMPPTGRPRPDAQVVDALASWLETELDQASSVKPQPGRTETFHRLNRTEYRNALRDLLALDVSVASLLPADDAMQGFDNIADVLSVSPALFEGYLSAARKFSRAAVGVAPPTPVVRRYNVPKLLQNEQGSEDLPFGSRGGAAIPHDFPVDGEYSIKISLQRTFYDYVRGMGRPHQIDVRIDGTLVKRFTVGGESHGRQAPSSFSGNVTGVPEWETYTQNADSKLDVRVAVTAGRRIVGVSFIDELTIPEDPFSPVSPRGEFAREDEIPDGNPAIEMVAIGGPYVATGSGDTPSRRRIFVCRPARGIEEAVCAKKILATLARRAYRRPITGTDLKTLLGFYDAGRKEGGFDAGIQFALERVLVDPDFLFRAERDPRNASPDTTYRLSDLELASRLSFFLWSSIPDDELLELAARRRLRDPAVLARQTQRMLKDPRSVALVETFAGQWLGLRQLQDIAPDSTIFPDFDEDLREAFQRETELFIGSQMREDRTVVDLLSANYTFVNERLARHYGIPNVFGIHYRRMTLPAAVQRGGLLGQGSILTLTSYANRTSPVVRGKWILSTLLGTPPPPPPPDVPQLAAQRGQPKPTSIRALLEDHRKNPVCATCHAQMDPLGFALENFDGIGGWRTTDGSAAIDASGSVPGGAKFEGVAGLRAMLLSRKHLYVGALTEKLLAYAVGRAVQPYDMPSIRRIVRDAAAADYRWSSLVLGIVKSTPFQMRQSHSRPESSSPSAAPVVGTAGPRAKG